VIQSEGERIIGVRGDSDHPANFVGLCTKGANCGSCVPEPRRLCADRKLDVGGCLGKTAKIWALSMLVALARTKPTPGEQPL
jgi:hypothetical protein